MPKATLSYLFELKIAGIVNSLAAQVMEDFAVGKEMRFILILNKKSNNFEYLPTESSDECFKTVDKLEEDECCFFFFDNFDKFEYSYLKWNRVSQQMMELLNGIPFEENDFIHMRTKEKGKYRESGSVIIG